MTNPTDQPWCATHQTNHVYGADCKPMNTPHQPEDGLRDRYWVALNQIDDLTPFIDAVDILKSYSDKGQVNNMRRYLVTLYADLFTQHEATLLESLLADMPEKFTAQAAETTHGKVFNNAIDQATAIIQARLDLVKGGKL